MHKIHKMFIISLSATFYYRFRPKGKMALLVAKVFLSAKI